MWNKGKEGIGMELRALKADPSGNTTIIVLDPVERKRHGEIAAKIMALPELGAEQVGFLEAAKDPLAAGRLQMMGGEFCGNGCRSFAAAAALGALDGGPPVNFEEQVREVVIEASGHRGILTAMVENRQKDNECFVEIGMPLPQSVRHGVDEALGEYSLVIFEGIVHMLLWDRAVSALDIPPVREFLLREGADVACFGALFYDRKLNYMVPAVYVEGSDTLVWEGSCGSGVVAAAAALSEQLGQTQLYVEVAQPGGSLFASVDWEENRKAVRLSGPVTLAESGSFILKL